MGAGRPVEWTEERIKEICKDIFFEISENGKFVLADKRWQIDLFNQLFCHCGDGMNIVGVFQQDGKFIAAEPV